MGYLGLEPRTNRLKADYSTIELATLSEILASVNKDVKVFLTNNFYLSNFLGIHIDSSQFTLPIINNDTFPKINFN